MLANNEQWNGSDLLGSNDCILEPYSRNLLGIASLPTERYVLSTETLNLEHQKFEKAILLLNDKWTSVTTVICRFPFLYLMSPNVWIPEWIKTLRLENIFKSDPVGTCGTKENQPSLCLQSIYRLTMKRKRLKLSKTIERVIRIIICTFATHIS